MRKPPNVCSRTWAMTSSYVIWIKFHEKLWFLTSICCLETWFDDWITKSAVWLFLPTIVFVCVIWYVPIPSQTSSPKTSRVFDWLLFVIIRRSEDFPNLLNELQMSSRSRLLQTVFFPSSVDFLGFYIFFISFNFSFFFDFSLLFWVNWKSMRPSVVIVLKAAWASFLSSHWPFS